MRIKKALFLGTLCTAVSGMSLFAQAGVSYAKSAKEATEEISSEEATEVESDRRPVRRSPIRLPLSMHLERQ